MTDERYTEQWVIDAARATIGAIDFDPASCSRANLQVQATVYYDKQADGLARPWFGRVFTNPPYSRANGFIAKLLREWEEGRVTQAVLVFSSRDTGFLVDRGQQLLRHGSLLLPAKRIKYLDPVTGKLTGSRFGSLVLYAGPNRLGFAKVFGGRGMILRPAPDFYLRLARRGKPKT